MDNLEACKVLEEMGFCYEGWVRNNKPIDRSTRKGEEEKYFYFNKIPTSKGFVQDRQVYVVLTEGTPATMFSDTAFVQDGKVYYVPKAHKFLLTLCKKEATGSSKTIVLTYWRENSNTSPILFVSQILGSPLLENTVVTALQKGYNNIAQWIAGLVFNVNRDNILRRAYSLRGQYTNASIEAYVYGGKPASQTLTKKVDINGKPVAITVASAGTASKAPANRGSLLKKSAKAVTNLDFLKDTLEQYKYLGDFKWIDEPEEMYITDRVYAGFGDQTKCTKMNIFATCTDKGESKMVYIDQHTAKRGTVPRACKGMTYQVADTKAHRKVLVPATHERLIKYVLSTGTVTAYEPAFVLTTKSVSKKVYATCIVGNFGNEEGYYFTFVFDLNDNGTMPGPLALKDMAFKADLGKTGFKSHRYIPDEEAERVLSKIETALVSCSEPK